MIFVLYRCYYQHKLRDSVYAVYGIFYIIFFAPHHSSLSPYVPSSKYLMASSAPFSVVTSLRPQAPDFCYFLVELLCLLLVFYNFKGERRRKKQISISGVEFVDCMHLVCLTHQFRSPKLYVAVSDPGSINFLGQSPRDWKTTMHQMQLQQFSIHKTYVTMYGKLS